MSGYYFKDWCGPITAAIADAEPMNQRLFAESEAECTPNAGIRKPNTSAPRAHRSAPGALRNSGKSYPKANVLPLSARLNQT
jgi:hypothetical protein